MRWLHVNALLHPALLHPAKASPGFRAVADLESSARPFPVRLAAQLAYRWICPGIIDLVPGWRSHSPAQRACAPARLAPGECRRVPACLQAFLRSRGRRMRRP